MDLSKYLGIPYLWDGRSFEGVDCYGLLILFYREELGVELFDPKHGLKGWKEASESGFMAQNAERDWREVPMEEVLPKDVLLLRSSRSGRADHCGLVVDRYSFLHAAEGIGSHIAKVALFREQIVRCYRHRSLT